MALWLFKEEPSTFSFADLQKKGKATWDGVSNALALKHLRLVQKGDKIFFYETGKVKAVVGIMQATADANTKEKLATVTVAPVEALPTPISLATVKADKQLKSWELARLPRLSIMPVTEQQWQRVLELSST